jgi:hypothetical protein
MIFLKTHIIKILTSVSLLVFLCYAINITMKNANAYTNGICIKAHPYSSFFRSTAYTTSVRYKYKGQFYSGEVISPNKLFLRERDTCYIKIDPTNPQYLSYSDECK